MSDTRGVTKDVEGEAIIEGTDGSIEGPSEDYQIYPWIECNATTDNYSYQVVYNVSDCTTTGECLVVTREYVDAELHELQFHIDGYLPDAAETDTLTCTVMMNHRIRTDMKFANDAIRLNGFIYPGGIGWSEIGSSLQGQPGNLSQFDLTEEIYGTGVGDHLLDSKDLVGCDGLLNSGGYTPMQIDPLGDPIGGVDSGDTESFQMDISVAAIKGDVIPDPDDGSSGYRCDFQTLKPVTYSFTGLTSGGVNLASAPYKECGRYCDDLNYNCDVNVCEYPEVTSMDKSANASTSSGSVNLYLGMSEPMVVPPSIVYDGEGVSPSISKAIVSAQCTLLDEGRTVRCPMTVAGCEEMRDYSVTVRGGSDAEGLQMSPFETVINSGDMEARDIDEIYYCWDQTFGAIAQLSMGGAGLRWEILSSFDDISEANVYKELFGVPDVAVAMRIRGAPALLDSPDPNFVGTHISPYLAGAGLNDAYRIMMGDVVMTTWTDDFNVGYYTHDTIDPNDLSTYYTCMVKKGDQFKYFISIDGHNYIEFTSANMVLLFEGECGLPAPVDAGWTCPPDPMTEICDPTADWVGGACLPEYATYQDCLDMVEANFTLEYCGEGGFENAFGEFWDMPKVRIMGYGHAGAITPAVDYVRFRTTNIAGDVSDCPALYGGDVCGAVSDICSISQIILNGAQSVCLSCFDGDVADENTLQCLLDNVCQGDIGCTDGLSYACKPYEERCVIGICQGAPGCEACFPGGEPDEDTLSCLQTLCGVDTVCLDQMLMLCSS